VSHFILPEILVMTNFINKYNVPGPRYTSYPTVPYWNPAVADLTEWTNSVKEVFDNSNEKEGISIYIHLPFCESLCTYCGCNTRITVNHAVESPYINAVLKEWELYRKVLKEIPRIKEIHLGGGTPTFFSSLNLEKLIHGILKDSVVCEDAEFSFEAHPNNTTAEHLQVLYKMGFRRLSLGIQDFDPAVQAIVNRIQPFENVEKVVLNARETGYTSINFDLIYGLPLQTRSSILDTIEKVNLLRPDRIAFYSYAHIPWIKPGQRRFTENDLPADAEKRALYETGKTQLMENGYVEIGMDHFSLKGDSLYKAAQSGRLHRNFMGYTSSDTTLMIGLGVSSISDTWKAYGQNVKKVEEYYKLLNVNKLPIVKSHYLSADDLVLRRHILNIICKLETSWNMSEQQSPQIVKAIMMLEEMKKDGLININNNHLLLNETARPYIRNVCMAFDAYLFNQPENLQIFSTIA
jgi:oxygen-independent coproporphyrinogen III oxidase